MIHASAGWAHKQSGSHHVNPFSLNIQTELQLQLNFSLRRVFHILQYYLTWIDVGHFFQVLSLLLHKFWCWGGLGAVDHGLLCWAAASPHEKTEKYLVKASKSVKIYSGLKPHRPLGCFFFSWPGRVVFHITLAFEKKKAQISLRLYVSRAL